VVALVGVCWKAASKRLLPLGKRQVLELERLESATNYNGAGWTDLGHQQTLKQFAGRAI
jgi:hypothetical protein